QVVALIREGKKNPAPSMFELLKPGDLLLVEGDAEALKELTDKFGLTLEADRKVETAELKAEDVIVTEVVIPPGSSAAGNTVMRLDLRWRYRVNVLAVARLGQRLSVRVAKVRLQAGDILLLQGPEKKVQEMME